MQIIFAIFLSILLFYFINYHKFQSNLIVHYLLFLKIVLYFLKHLIVKICLVNLILLKFIHSLLFLSNPPFQKVLLNIARFCIRGQCRLEIGPVLVCGSAEIGFILRILRFNSTIYIFLHFRIRFSFLVQFFLIILIINQISN